MVVRREGKGVRQLTATNGNISVAHAVFVVPAPPP